MNWIKEIPRVKVWKKYSQYGEESYLDFIFKNIGTTNKFFIDLGAWDGQHLSNTKYFAEKKWEGLLIDGKDFPNVKNHFVTRENVLTVLKKYNTPTEPDLLSLDIDGNDYWILKKILSKFKPRVIISEYNSEHIGSKTIKYNPDFVFWPCHYYGYTFDAGVKLADEFGYKVVFQNSSLNMYYVRKDIVGEVEHIANPGIHKWWGKPDNMTIKEEWVNV